MRNGFVNYFGVQRFGAEGRSVNASDVGLAMLKGDMVFDLILTSVCLSVFLSMRGSTVS